MKPIGHYTSHLPGDGSYFDVLVHQYGSCLERMTRRERFYLISAISTQLCLEMPGVVRDEIYLVANDISLLPNGDRKGLIQLFADNTNFLPTDKDNTGSILIVKR
jgi:hypothetical protein